MDLQKEINGKNVFYALSGKIKIANIVLATIYVFLLILMWMTIRKDGGFNIELLYVMLPFLLFQIFGPYYLLSIFRRKQVTRSRLYGFLALYLVFSTALTFGFFILTGVLTSLYRPVSCSELCGLGAFVFLVALFWQIVFCVLFGIGVDLVASFVNRSRNIPGVKQVIFNYSLPIFYWLLMTISLGTLLIIFFVEFFEGIIF